MPDYNNGPIYVKSFDFSLKIISFYKHLISEKEYVISKQLLRSGTAIGALVREAYHGESKADFIHKMSIALKEANETRYWIEIIEKGNIVSFNNEISILFNLSDELIRILVSIIKTSKSK
jgi:four helix bundle protein